MEGELLEDEGENFWRMEETTFEGWRGELLKKVLKKFRE